MAGLSPRAPRRHYMFCRGVARAIRKVEVAVAVSPPVIRSGGISFPWRAPIFSGRYFQPRPRPPRGQPFLPPNLVAWPATPPKVIDLPMATLQERHPTPTWLPEASQALFQKGLAAITSPEFLQTPGLNHSHFLPAYCALTMAGFQRNHLQLVCDARIAASFGPLVLAPLLMGNTSEVQTYLDNVISCCDPTWSHVLQKQRSRPTLSAPNDDLILPWNHKNIQRKLPCYIDDLYKRLAALSAQLAGHDMPKSPQGWVTLSTLRKYTGPDVQGNVDVGSQNIVATRPFTITSNDSMIPLTFELLEALVTADGRRGQTRFQLGQLPAGRALQSA